MTLKLAHREKPSDGPGEGISWKQHPQLRGCGVFRCLLSRDHFYHLSGWNAAGPTQVFAALPLEHAVCSMDLVLSLKALRRWWEETLRVGV